MRSLFLIFLTVLLSLSAPGQTVDGPYDTLIIEGVTVIDGSGSPAYGPVDVTVKSNRIESIRPSGRKTDSELDSSKKSMRIIDGKGMYVMPGIIDLHTHINFDEKIPAEYIYKLLVGHGVTSARIFNYGREDPKGMVAEKKRAIKDDVVAPRLFLYPFYKDVNTVAGAKKLIQEWHKLGIDGVKVLSKPGLWEDVFSAICSETQKYNMGVAVHIAQTGVYPVNAVRAAQLGVSTIEHHYGYPESAYTGQIIQDLPAEYNYANEAERFLETAHSWLQANLHKLHGDVIDSLLEANSKSGFIMDPTFNIYEANRDVTRLQNLPWHESYALPALMDSFVPNPKRHASYFYDWTSNKEADWSRMYQRWMNFVNEYKNRGGVVSVGSDSGYLFQIWGFGTIRELELLEEAGFSPLETIHAATENGAKALKQKDIGVIRPGYLADMLIMTENPLVDLKVLYGTGATRVSTDGTSVQKHGLKYTIRNGVIYDAQDLLKDVRDMVTKAKGPETEKVP